MPADKLDINDAMADVTADVMKQFVGTTATATEDDGPDDTDADDSNESPDEELNDDESPAETDDEQDGHKDKKPEDVELPEGMLAVPTISDKMVTEFVVKDTEGEEVEPPALIIEYKANGKVRKDRIDQVVKLAQYGVYNQEREQSLLAKQAEMEETVEQTNETLTLRDEQIRRILEDEEVYLKVRERYLQENAPEKRAARAEDEAKSLRQERQEERIVKQAEMFYERRVLPAIDDIAEANPEIELDELTAQFSAAMVPLMRNGRIPVEAYPQVEAYIDNTLREWAERKNSARIERLSGEKKKKEEATIAAAKAKRVAATATRPVVRSSPSSGDRKAPKKHNPTVEEAQNDAMDSILSSIRRTND